jgi:hypothetical protein
MEILKDLMQVIPETFNNSPMALREKLRFGRDDAARKNMELNGDHALAVEKFGHGIHDWKRHVTTADLGMEEMLNLSPVDLDSLLCAALDEVEAG